MSLLSAYIGSNGRAFERVSQVFEKAGYAPARPDSPAGDGAFVCNIVSQYQSDMSQKKCLALIRYALESSLAEL